MLVVCNVPLLLMCHVSILRAIINKLVGSAPSADGSDTVVSALYDPSSLADFVRLLREVDAEDAVSSLPPAED